MPRPIRWLHLSDLHLGCRGRDLWWQVREDFERSIRETAARLGPPELILISGDVANAGRAEEYEAADRFLDALREWLGSAPLVVPVPGNHDLQRPAGMAALPYRVLDDYQKDAEDPNVRTLVRTVKQTLWRERDASFVEPLFAGYGAWLERSILPELESRARTLHRSHFPGDLCLELELPQTFPLCIVGLNSAWLQYRAGDYEGGLMVPPEQFHAALPAEKHGSPLAVFRRCERALLVMHHPPSWLSARARRTFLEEIYNPDRFDLCLHGHLHEARSESVAISAGSTRYYFQSRSLFGLEGYGTRNEERRIGYAWGTLSAAGEVRLVPLERIARGDGVCVFVHDDAFPKPDPDGVLIREPHRASSPLPAAAPQRPDLRSYLEDLVDRTDHIKISGIAATTATGAIRPPIEELYTPLRSRGEPRGGEPEAALAAGGPVALAEVFPRHRRLLIEGQPGAGKTTFLRFAACMLARDALGRDRPDGGSWSRHHLGLEEEDRAVPVLVGIAALVTVLTGEDASLRQDGCLWLLHLLERWCVDNGHPVALDQWQRLLESGEAILLLDGLDEVADERLRERVFEIFRDACRRWQCRIVVASRPIQTAALREMGFHTTTIEPFGEDEIRTFIDHWVAALHAAPSAGRLHGEAERYRDRLLAALGERPRVRRLAANPVMLTCLCVVHWNEGQLPEGRSRVYRAVLRWLIASRTRLREQEGWTDPFAWRGFARLALAMMDAEGGKRAIMDLEEGALAVDPVMEREFPGLAAEDRRRRAREWLRFECLGSGVVEEVAGNRIRFWHLTFQEFLAALQLAWRGDGEDPEEDWWPLVRDRLDAVQWRETIELLPGCLHDEGGVGRVDRLLDRVLALRGPAPELAAEARVAGIVGRLLQALTVYQYRPRPAIDAAWREALKRSLEIFTVDGAAQVPVKVRIAAAEALGRGGDPRLAVERDNFIEVPGYGGARLGKYPVTVEEYQRFVVDGGYEEDKYWDGDGWSLRSKEGWEEPRDWQEQLETPNRPVTGVSWWEAVAYCRWLSERWKAREVRLPSGAEWEKAATPAQGKYPWGDDEPDAERANFDLNVGSPTPVGVYPAGDGPFGHSDLAGNVWEWCAGTMVRGGGWLNPAGGLRAACRDWIPAGDRNDVLGFRVVVAPAST